MVGLGESTVVVLGGPEVGLGEWPVVLDDLVVVLGEAAVVLGESKGRLGDAAVILGGEEVHLGDWAVDFGDWAVDLGEAAVAMLCFERGRVGVTPLDIPLLSAPPPSPSWRPTGEALPPSTSRAHIAAKGESASARSAPPSPPSPSSAPTCALRVRASAPVRLPPCSGVGLFADSGSRSCRRCCC